MIRISLLFTLISFNAVALDITCDVLNCNSTNNSLFETIDTTVDSKNLVSKDITGYDVNLYSTNESGHVNSILAGKINSLNIFSNANNSNGFKKSATVASVVGNLNIESQGFNGSNGKNTSRICAENFISGNYGIDAYNFFVGRHVLSSTTICDSIDYNYLLNNKFECDPGYSLSPTSSASISLLESKRACRANIVRNKCVKKTFNIACKQRFTDFKCCSSSNTWSNLINSSLPHSFIISAIGATCNPAKCVGQFNGYELTKNYIGNLDNVNDSDYCSTKFNIDNPTISYAAGALTSSVSINSTTRNGVSLPLPTVRDGIGTTLPVSDYNLFLSNVSEINSSSLSVRNCLGLDGSASNDYICDIKPGRSVGLKLKAIDKYGNISNEVTVTIGGNIYLSSMTLNTYKYKYVFTDNTAIGLTQIDTVKNFSNGSSSGVVSGFTTSTSTNNNDTSFTSILTNVTGYLGLSDQSALVTPGGAGTIFRRVGYNMSRPNGGGSFDFKMGIFNGFGAEFTSSITLFPTVNYWADYACGLGCSVLPPVTAITYPPTSIANQTGIEIYADFNGVFP